MLKRLAIFMALVCAGTAAWADAAKDCFELSGDVAIAACNEAIRINPRDPMNFLNRGSEYRKKGDYDQALADYNRAIELDPRDPGAYTGRGNVYSFRKEYDRALRPDPQPPPPKTPPLKNRQLTRAASSPPGPPGPFKTLDLGGPGVASNK